MNRVDDHSILNRFKKKTSAAQLSKHAVQPNVFGPGLPCVRSEDLIGKDREIMIEHCGVYYRLRITRANKLILTK